MPRTPHALDGSSHDVAHYVGIASTQSLHQRRPHLADASRRQPVIATQFDQGLDDIDFHSYSMAPHRSWYRSCTVFALHLLVLRLLCESVGRGRFTDELPRLRVLLENRASQGGIRCALRRWTATHHQAIA